MDTGESPEDMVAGLYAVLRRPRPVILLARDPAEHARLTLAAARPAFDGFVTGMLIGGAVMSAVYLSLAFLRTGPLPSWRPMLFSGLVLALVPAWLMYSPLGRTRFIWFAFVLLAGLLLGGALAGLILGGLWGLGLGVLLASLLWLWLGIARVVLGPVWARWRLRRQGAGLSWRGGVPLRAVVEERLRHAAEGLRDPLGPSAMPQAPLPEEREAGRRIRLLLERQPIYLLLAYEVEPSLGRGLDDGRVGGGRLRRVASAPTLPVLAERALALDRAVVAATLLEGCAILLPRVAQAPSPAAQATPAQVVETLLAPAGLVGLVERLPTELGLWLVARVLDREPDAALRQEGAERLGPGRVFAVLRRVPVAEDATGALFALGPEPQPMLFVRVEDKVIGPEGLARRHWLPVPPHVASPKEAVAWTFGRPASAYAPELET